LYACNCAEYVINLWQLKQKGGALVQELSFYDVKSKKKFNSSDYKIVEKKGRFFAVTKSQSGSHECWRVVSKDAAAKLK